MFEYFLEGIYKIIFNFKIKCGILVFWCFFLNKKEIIFMYLKLLDFIIVEEF